jgi:hypothetical protein
MDDRCPRCGFKYAWDGTSCKHCHPEEEKRPASLGEILDAPARASLRGVLAFGVAAALMAGCLAILAWSSGAGLREYYRLAGVLAEAAVLWVFLRLAYTAGTKHLAGLDRGAVGYYGSVWVLVGLSVSPALRLDLGGSGVWNVGVLAVGLGLLVVTVFTLRWMTIPLLVAACCNLYVWVLLVIVAGAFGPDLVDPPDTPYFLLLVTGRGALAAYACWLAIALLACRHLLGPASRVIGGVLLLRLVTEGTFLLWVFTTFLGETSWQFAEQFKESMRRGELSPANQAATLAVMGLDVATSIGIALLFWGIRRRLTCDSPSAG